MSVVRDKFADGNLVSAATAYSALFNEPAPATPLHRVHMFLNAQTRASDCGMLGRVASWIASARVAGVI
jgi:hypothetical protein